MGLPIGFNPRKCPFCDCRMIVNSEVELGVYKAICTFCGAQGPNGCSNNDDAWLAWNGQTRKAPATGVEEGVF